MLYEEIESYFKGSLQEETKKWIAENCRSLSEEETDNFKKELFEHSSKMPDIQKLKTVLEKVTGKKPRSYVWAVCLDCGCEYDYELMTCPKCYKAGKVYNKYATKNSEYPPSKKVIFFNKKSYLKDKDDESCIDCPTSKGEWAYCKHFGNPRWTCNDSDFRSCACKQCCIRHKKLNANTFGVAL